MKAWTFIKTLFCLLTGAWMMFAIIEALIGNGLGSHLIYFISCYVWICYVVDSFYPEIAAKRKR